jgi:hypothetical protein
MSSSGRWLTAGTICLVYGASAIWISPGPLAEGQEKSKTAKKTTKPGKTKPLGNTKNLDIKADQLQSSFSRDAEELAGQYAEAGHLDKAKALLESALAVNPQSPNLQKKLEQVKEGIMNSNDSDIEVNSSHGWESSGVGVFEGRAVRIKAEGTYKFDTGAGNLTAAGFADKDPGQDLVSGIPCGALMGVIVSDTKSGKPFLIGDSLEFTPKETGLLMLRVNAPPGNKNSGKLKISVSGFVQAK